MGRCFLRGCPFPPGIVFGFVILDGGAVGGRVAGGGVGFVPRAVLRMVDGGAHSEG